MRRRKLASVSTLTAALCLMAPACGDDDFTGFTAEQGPGRPNGEDGVSAETQLSAEAGESGSGAESGDGDGDPGFGDNLEHIAFGTGSEVVGVDRNARYAVSCGGFGARVDDVSQLPTVAYVGRMSARCQNVALAPAAVGQNDIFVVAHHGDSYVPGPHLEVAMIVAGVVTATHRIEGEGKLFEGLAFRGDDLFVALHGGGLEVYQLDRGTGELSLRGQLSTGFSNAIELAVAGDFLYVADGVGGIKVVDVSSPTTPSLVGEVSTAGMARHLTVHANRLYTALGGDGIVVHDLSNPAAPTELARIPSKGSVQAVAAGGGIIAAAQWTHVAVYDAASFELVGTERVNPYPGSEQDLAIHLLDGVLTVGEWNAMHYLQWHPDLSAPDLWVDQTNYTFTANEADSKVVAFENRGSRPLVVSSVELDNEAYAHTAQLPIELAPGARAAFEVSFTPPAPMLSNSVLSLHSNDPDEGSVGSRVPIVARETAALDVGGHPHGRLWLFRPLG